MTFCGCSDYGVKIAYGTQKVNCSTNVVQQPRPDERPNLSLAVVQDI